MFIAPPLSHAAVVKDEFNLPISKVARIKTNVWTVHVYTAVLASIKSQDFGIDAFALPVFGVSTANWFKRVKL